MKAYPDYKDSGFDRLGKVPSHWGVYNLKRMTNFNYGNSLSKEIRIDGKIPVYGSNGVVGYHDESITKSPCIIVGRKGSFGKVNYSEIECFPIDTTYFIDETATKNNLRWLYYLLLSLRLDAFSKDSAVPGLSREDAYEKRAVLPSLSEQQAIADFLDRKTAQIDTLIEKKQRQIDLLHEQRTALINHAVTKGLNPKVKMKDSGVEWLGEIPSHWEVKRIKHLIQSKKNSIKTGPFGSQLTNADMAGTDVKVYNQRSVIDNDFVNGENYVSLEKFQQLKEFEIYAGDILITTRGTIGRCAIFPENAEKGILHPCLIRLQMNEELILKEYLIGFIQDSVLFKQSIFFESNATTIEVIYSGTMKQVPVPVPPVEEQQKIIKYLSELKNKVQLATEKLENEIMLLQEYRTALISEAVTGKIDVRTAETVHESPTGTM